MGNSNHSLRAFILASVAAALLPSAPALAAARLDPMLVPFARGQTQHRTARVIVVLNTRRDGGTSPRRYDHAAVCNYLKARSNQAFAELREYLGTQAAAPRSIRVASMYWMNSTISADVTAEGLRILSAAPGASKIYANRIVRNEPDRVPRRRVPPPSRLTDADFPYQFREMGLDRLIQADPRIDGRGVIVGHLDTGVDGNHPALRGKIVRFFNATTRAQGQPTDPEQHGTHTAGTIVGGDRNSVTIGVAPGARLISAAGLGTFDDILAAMQFFLDPDGNPQTQDSPRAINNSWNSEGAPDVEPFYAALGAWEAAGILPVISAGNNGPGPQTITVPHEHPATLTIGATGEDGLVAQFSSRGPALFRGNRVNKPDLTAPGDKIRSSVPGGQFSEMGGTSMSTPQVTGATALLLQTDPRLTPDQIRKILIDSARPVDENGRPQRARAWNANYGLGKLDIFGAVQLARRVGGRRDGLRPPPVAGFDPLASDTFLSSPEDQTVSWILREDMVTVEELTEYPAAFQGTDWVSPSQIWR
jgi:bacillopeptidase F